MASQVVYVCVYVCEREGEMHKRLSDVAALLIFPSLAVSLVLFSVWLKSASNHQEYKSL